MFIVLMIVYLVIVYFAAVPLYKNNKYKELMIYGVLCGLALVLNILLILEIKVPSPSHLIQKVVFTLIGKGSEE